MYVVFFFKQKTACEMRISDWSSDVCSSDLVFIHVPKTAGSTVNAIMKGHSPNGQGHIEELLDEDMEFKKAVNNLDWMSGHVSRDRIAIRIREVSRRPEIGRASCRERVCQYV